MKIGNLAEKNALPVSDRYTHTQQQFHIPLQPRSSCCVISLETKDSIAIQRIAVCSVLDYPGAERPRGWRIGAGPEGGRAMTPRIGWWPGGRIFADFGRKYPVPAG